MKTIKHLLKIQTKDSGGWGGAWGQMGVLWITVAEAETAPTMWLATYINSVEQKIEMEMWALKECDSHLPLDRG